MSYLLDEMGLMPTEQPRGRPRYDDLLTPAEWRVAEFVRHGLTNPQIARLQGVSVDADQTRWYLQEDDAIAGIDQGKWRFWTTGGGKSVWVLIATHNGRRNLKTEPDGVQPNNLLGSPECP